MACKMVQHRVGIMALIKILRRQTERQLSIYSRESRKLLRVPGLSYSGHKIPPRFGSFFVVTSFIDSEWVGLGLKPGLAKQFS